MGTVPDGAGTLPSAEESCQRLVSTRGRGSDSMTPSVKLKLKKAQNSMDTSDMTSAAIMKFFKENADLMAFAKRSMQLDRCGIKEIYDMLQKQPLIFRLLLTNFYEIL
ncbi:MAG: hypothetical protein HUJ80_05645 [Firmicutes bacterium]|nr:hypothetical protein [Bacillota bacterium]